MVIEEQFDDDSVKSTNFWHFVNLSSPTRISYSCRVDNEFMVVHHFEVLMKVCKQPLAHPTLVSS
ncbi:MAG: hypothetical protein BWK78_01980 [Thiotrichaceae bacterium IS1]|nr:MAG: hypothetical protein BWK78_01980 [Thiotrichaceae bacterium IS1]